MTAHSSLSFRAKPNTGILPDAAAEKHAILQAESLDAASHVENRRKLGAPLGETPAIASGLKFLLTAIDDFLTLQRSQLKMADPVAVPKDATLANIRVQIAELSSEIAELVAQPPTKEEVAERIRRGFAAIEVQGTPVMSQVRRDAFSVDPAQGIRTAFNAASTADALAITAWALGADVLAQRMIDAIPEDAADAMSADEKQEKLKQLSAQIIATQRVEEAIICREAEAGRTIARRAEAHPAAVLGVV